jgi:cell fate (sporulation/competence/biofilm development) regulator YlbF (YheA/YmcA/DUF963 family)
MGDVLAKAADLGRAIRETGKFKALRAAEAEAMKSPDSVKLASALAQLQQEKAAAEKAGKDPGAAFRERYDKIEAAVALDPRLVALARAQAEFQALVNDVSRTMLEQLKADGA